MIGWGIEMLSGPGSQPSGLWFRCSGSDPGPRTEFCPYPHLYLINRTCDLRAETCDPEMFLPFAQIVGRFALLHLGQHVVLSLPHAHLAAVSSTPASTPRAQT